MMASEISAISVTLFPTGISSRVNETSAFEPTKSNIHKFRSPGAVRVFSGLIECRVYATVKPKCDTYTCACARKYFWVHKTVYRCVKTIHPCTPQARRGYVYKTSKCAAIKRRRRRRWIPKITP